jgi:hypothetical protein
MNRRKDPPPCRQRPLALLLFACACASTPPSENAAMNDPVPSAPWKLTYADGSANVYSWWQDQAGSPVYFVYDPVTPETSSTGSYSGGSPREEQLSAGDARLGELWSTARALQRDTAHHAPSRDKGTGAFSLVTPQGEERFIVQQGERLASLSPLLARFGVK